MISITERQFMKLYEVMVRDDEGGTLKLHSIAAKNIGLALQVSGEVFTCAHIHSIVERGVVCVASEEENNNNG